MKIIIAVVVWLALGMGFWLRAQFVVGDIEKQNKGRSIHPLQDGIVQANVLLGSIVVLLAGILSALLVSLF